MIRYFLLFTVALITPTLAFAKAERERERSSYSYSHEAQSDCTGETVFFTTHATVNRTSVTNKKGTRERYTITLRSRGYGMTSGIEYDGYERARIITLERDGVTNQTIEVDVNYNAKGQAPDLYSHQFVHLYTDENGVVSILAESYSTECR